jgi:hypothetical protein
MSYLRAKGYVGVVGATPGEPLTERGLLLCAERLLAAWFATFRPNPLPEYLLLYSGAKGSKPG